MIGGVDVGAGRVVTVAEQFATTTLDETVLVADVSLTVTPAEKVPVELYVAVTV
jgi:hypothetical protein